MKRIFLFFYLLLLSLLALAQADYITSKSFRSSKGIFTVFHYTENMYKIKFHPNEYSKSELTSDAVIMKLPAMSGHPFKARLIGDTVFLNDKAVVVGTCQTKEYGGFYFPLQNGEMIFGGGERALPLNRRGYRLNLYNNPWYGYGEGADNLNYSVPFITSSNGYGLFFDNPSKSFLDIGKANKDVLEYGTSSGEINVYVIFGNYQQILQSYHKLTGTQPLPPRWALGNLMSRFGYTSEKQVKNILQKMKEENIPVDAIIFDLFWFGDSIQHTLGNLDWVNKNAWPDPKKMISNFKKDGINTILVTEPFFVETSKNYEASKKYFAVDSLGKPYYLTDFYFGRGGLVDIFRNDSKKWFWQFYKKQMEIGVEAWWGDLGEPEKHPSNLYHNLKDYGYKRLFNADEVHNIYGHNWTKMLYDYYAKEYANKRLFSLNRSGFAGTQRYSIFPWTGDVSRSWSGFRAQLPILLGMSMSGVPYVHSDAGGFAGGEGDNELYVRWLQFAAFTPIFRPHGTALYGKDTAAFSFPSEPALIAEPYKTYAKNAVSFRYMMLPYNYSTAYQQTVSGEPLIAPLYFRYLNDTTTLKIEDEYLWGENLLVAPVMQKGARERILYLPKGKWLDIFSTVVYDGGKWITIPVDLKFSPVFMKEGAFVPTVSKIKNVSEYSVKGQFLLNYFPSTMKTRFSWFEDDGISRNSLLSKKYTLIKCSGQDEGKKIVVEVNPSNKLFFPAHLAVSTTVTKKPAAVIVNGKAIPIISDVSKTDASNPFALWMPQISAVQVYTQSLKYSNLKIEIVK
jgi:oligosaccharide 4-alpha-D-glucosyltransferase